MGEKRFRRSPQALHAAIGDDVVALQAQRGSCFGLENVTAEVWRLLEQEPTLQELCDRLVEEYEVDPLVCRSEVASLLEAMREEGLVELAS